MELVGLIAYEREFEVEIVNPIDKAGTGIKFWVVHPEAASTTEILQSDAAAEAMEASTVGEQSAAVVAASVRRWEWPKDVTIRGEKPGEFSYENVLAVLLDPDLRFIVGQIRAEVNNEAKNFTRA